MAFGQNNDYINEIIRLGFDCNEKCLFCNYVPNKDIHYFKSDLNQIKKEIEIIYEKRKNDIGKVLLSFSGGEPCLWGNILIESIRYAKHLGFGYIQIQTNATLITDTFAKKLKESGIDEAFVSLHSFQGETLEKMTLLPNSLKLTLQGIQNLKNHHISIVISHVLNKINYQEFPNFINFIINHSFTNIISLGIVQPHGETEKNLDTLMVSYQEMIPYIQLGMQKAKENNIQVGLHYCSLPLCIYEKTEDNLEFELHYALKLGISKNYDTIKILQNNKTKVSACKKCFYNHYCLGVWKKYLDFFGKDSIQPTKKYTDLSKNNQLQNENEAVIFFPQTQPNDIKNLLLSGKILVQLMISYDDFLSHIKEIIIFIKNGVSVINIMNYTGEKLTEYKKNRYIIHKIFPFFFVNIHVIDKKMLGKLINTKE